MKALTSIIISYVKLKLMMVRRGARQDKSTNDLIAQEFLNDKQVDYITTDTSRT